MKRTFVAGLEVEWPSCWSWLLFCMTVALHSSFGAPEITEFLASNSSGLKDEDGDYSDWIEIHNPDSTPINLGNYFLTDKSANLKKWSFPSVTLDSGAYLVVFASGKNRTAAPDRLHTNFQLSSGGDYLALVAPDGGTVISEFGPAFPPQFENVSFGRDFSQGPTAVLSYFATPTPGAQNAAGTRAGPVVSADQPNPPQPSGGPLLVTATVRSVNAAAAEVKLYYRKMFAAEAVVDMKDDGQGGDEKAGDGVWTAIIPPVAFAPGEMTRWRFVAKDSQGTETKEPAYRDPRDSHQYFGTVTQDPQMETKLPVLHWFTTNSSGAGTSTGSRGAVYYDGEFYDNVLFTVHGQSTSGFPKKSYNIDFNRTQRFRWSPEAPRVADIDLLTNWADKSKVRHVLAYEVMRKAGMAAHFAYTVRVQQNGNFFSTADFVEDGDEIYLERAGLNPDGALYKVYGNLLDKSAGNTANSGVEKKTRKFENNSDLQALINGLALSGTNLYNYIYDNVDLPRCVNMLAANSVIRNIDMHSKNWYIYRDTGRSGEWAILPWDLDLSHGRVWNTQNTYFDNGIYTDGYVVTGDSIRLVSRLFANPAIRSMIFRRIRTLTDEFLQPPPAAGTPEDELFYERRLNEQSALIDPTSIVPSDAQRDFAKWGSWLQGGTVVSWTNTSPAVESMAEAIQRWKTEYLPARRRYIYNTQIAEKGGEIPVPQTGGPTYSFTPLLQRGALAKALAPVDGTLGFSWIGLTSAEPFDTSAWKSGVTGVGYERGSGYESLIGLDVNEAMRSNNSVYIRIEFEVTDPSAYDRIELRMQYDDGFVAFLNGTVLASANAPSSLKWNSAATAQHEASVTTVDVFDITAKRSSLRAGKNILAIQGLNDAVTSSDLIIVPELYGGKVTPGNPVEPVITFGSVEVNPVSGNQDEEYIQVRNTNRLAVDISHWRVSGAVEHTFAPGTVLPANGTLYLCPDAASFRARKVSPKGGEGLFLQGGYKGHLSNSGEALTLLTASGATNSVMTFTGEPSDAQRFLVISEIMYHPAGDGLAEFIEVMNISDSVTLDLSHVRFTQGVTFDFTGSAVSSLAPGARGLVVRDLAAFSAAYGANLPVAGVFTNGSALNNGGDWIKLEDAQNGTIQELEYDDAAPWPAGADGGGYSMVLIAPQTHPDPALAANWRSSARLGGNPGGSDTVEYPSDPSGDSNGNHEPDLIDYALGNDLGLAPILPAIVLEPDAVSGSATYKFTYPISLGADRAKVEIYYSTDLTAWQNGAQSLEQVSVEPLGDGRALVTCRLKPPLLDEDRVFLRLRVVGQ